MTAARIARLMEVYLCGSLLGVLVAVAIMRLILLFLEVPTPALVGALTA